MGDWLNDQKHGDATLTSTTSTEFLYDGQYKENLKHGFGRLISSKERYVGNFKLYIQFNND